VRHLIAFLHLRKSVERRQPTRRLTVKIRKNLDHFAAAILGFAQADHQLFGRDDHRRLKKMREPSSGRLGVLTDPRPPDPMRLGAALLRLSLVEGGHRPQGLPRLALQQRLLPAGLNDRSPNTRIIGERYPIGSGPTGNKDREVRIRK
jgi:hypothetical protein